MTTKQKVADPPPTHINPESWPEAISELLKLQGTPRIYRGQRNYDWTLRTRLGRDLNALPRDRNRLHIENSAIGFFMDRATGLLPSVPDEHDLLAWLSLMQHYGAPTRLLDWSQSPFVGAYFAYEQASDSDSAIYALDAHICRRQFMGSLPPLPWDHLGTYMLSRLRSDGQLEETYPIREQYRTDWENKYLRWAISKRSRWPFPTIPFNQDARMAAQQTIFTLVGDVDAVIDDLFDKDKWPPLERPPDSFATGPDAEALPLEWPGQLLTKIRLRAEWRAEALVTLGAMGLTASSIFPGLDGIGRATSLHVESGQLGLRDVITGLTPIFFQQSRSTGGGGPTAST